MQTGNMFFALILLVLVSSIEGNLNLAQPTFVLLMAVVGQAIPGAIASNVLASVLPPWLQLVVFNVLQHCASWPLITNKTATLISDR